jgi:hypothetical protein
MKLWLLRPVDDTLEPWMPWYDRMFGFVIRAEGEKAARKLASSKAGDEGPEAWLTPEHSTCVELKADGPEEVVMEDYNPAKVGSPPPKKVHAGPHQIPSRLARAKP